MRNLWRAKTHMMRCGAVLLCLWMPALMADKKDEGASRVKVTLHNGKSAKAEPAREPVPAVLDLDAAKRWALRESPTLAAGRMRLEQAREKITQVRSAYYPTIETSVGATNTFLDANTYQQTQEVTSLLESQAQQTARTTQLLDQLSQVPQLSVPVQYVRLLSTAFVGSSAKVERSYLDYNLSVTMYWSLFDGLAREYTHAASKVGLQEAEAALDEGHRMLLKAVASTYYTAELAREQVGVSEADEEFNLRMKKERDIRYQAGDVSYSEVLNFQVRANQGHTQIINSRRAYSSAMLLMAQLLGLPEGALPEGTELAPLPEPTEADLTAPPVEELLAYARRHRPDLEQKEKAVDRSELTVKAWRGRFFPTFGLSATEGTRSRDALSIDPDDFAGAVNLGMTYTVFAGGRNAARLREAKFAAEEARYDQSAADLQVANDVRMALDALKSAQEQYRLQQSSAKLVTEHRDMVEQGYQAGQLSLVMLNEAQRDLYLAKAQYAVAKVAVHQAWHDLIVATGEVLAPVEDKENK